MIYQVHFGANYETGEYGWTTNLEKVKKQIDWQLKEFPGIRWRRTTHYATLEKHASDCISCGHCDKRCPFHAVQTGRMKEIAAYFGK